MRRAIAVAKPTPAASAHPTACDRDSRESRERDGEQREAGRHERSANAIRGERSRPSRWRDPAGAGSRRPSGSRSRAARARRAGAAGTRAMRYGTFVSAAISNRREDPSGLCQRNCSWLNEMAPHSHAQHDGPSPCRPRGRRMLDERVVQWKRVRPSRSQSSRKPARVVEVVGPEVDDQRPRDAGRRGRGAPAPPRPPPAPRPPAGGGTTAGVRSASVTGSAGRRHEHGRVVVADPALQDLFALDARRFRVQAPVVFGRAGCARRSRRCGSGGR